VTWVEIDKILFCKWRRRPCLLLEAQAEPLHTNPRHDGQDRWNAVAPPEASEQARHVTKPEREKPSERYRPVSPVAVQLGIQPNDRIWCMGYVQSAGSIGP
jgi:hypothetical protein